jgi:hypothetical protein
MTLEETQKEYQQLKEQLEQVQVESNNKMEEMDQVDRECQDLESEIASSNKLQASKREQAAAQRSGLCIAVLPCCHQIGAYGLKPPLDVNCRDDLGALGALGAILLHVFISSGPLGYFSILCSGLQQDDT